MRIAISAKALTVSSDDEGRLSLSHLANTNQAETEN
jgi:hypothetical protein